MKRKNMTSYSLKTEEGVIGTLVYWEDSMQVVLNDQYSNRYKGLINRIIPELLGDSKAKYDEETMTVTEFTKTFPQTMIQSLILARIVPAQES